MYKSLCRPGITRKLTACAAGHINQELNITWGPLILNIAKISRGEKPAVIPVKQNKAAVKIGHHKSWSTVTYEWGGLNQNELNTQISIIIVE